MNNLIDDLMMASFQSTKPDELRRSIADVLDLHNVEPRPTLRQHYASLALQAMLTSERHATDPANVAADAFTYADAMLAHER